MHFAPYRLVVSLVLLGDLTTKSHRNPTGRLAPVRNHLRGRLPARPVTAFTMPALRGAALFLALFTSIGLVGEVRGRTADMSLWWIALHDLAFGERFAFLGAVSCLLGAWAVRPIAGRRRRWMTVALVAVAAVLALRDIGTFYAAVGAGNVRPFLPVPLSIVVAAVLGAIALAVATGRGAAPVGIAKRDLIRLAVATAAVALAFPLAQMLFFGTTDYRRPADAAVIFGAQVYPSGQPSQTLADRIATGVELYRQGLVPMLIMSGGVGKEGFDEAAVMRDVAVAAGVDPTAVVVDSAGVTTEATVANVAALLGLRSGGPTRLIAVSQAYHLPRVQLAFAVTGIDVLTVPAVDPQFIGPMPIMIAREVAAFWAYDLRVCLGW